MADIQRLAAAIDNLERPIDIFLHTWQQPISNWNAKINTALCNFEKEKKLA